MSLSMMLPQFESLFDWSKSEHNRIVLFMLQQDEGKNTYQAYEQIRTSYPEFNFRNGKFVSQYAFKALIYLFFSSKNNFKVSSTVNSNFEWMKCI
jgi:hypothetical protein